MIGLFSQLEATEADENTACAGVLVSIECETHDGVRPEQPSRFPQAMDVEETVPEPLDLLPQEALSHMSLFDAYAQAVSLLRDMQLQGAPQVLLGMVQVIWSFCDLDLSQAYDCVEFFAGDMEATR